MFHVVIFVGRLGKDPEMRYTPSGQLVTHFPVAVNRQWNNQHGETIQETVWFRVSVWGKAAEICNQYLQKGAKVLVEGRLTADPATGGPRIWQGSDGLPHASFEISAQVVRFLSPKSPEITIEDDDNIPF